MDDEREESSVFLELATAIPKTVNMVYGKFLLCLQYDSCLWGLIVAIMACNSYNIVSCINV